MELRHLRCFLAVAEGAIGLQQLHQGYTWSSSQERNADIGSFSP